MRTHLALLVCWLGATIGFSQQSSLPGPGSYGAKVVDLTDISFGEGPHQTLDLYLPAGAKSPPVVVCWFGGAFWAGDKSHMAGVASFFASRGFAAVAPNYLLGTKDGTRSTWPHCVFDAKAAVRFIKANASTLGVDAKHIAALGYSSGAYLAMMVGFTPNLLELEGNKAPMLASSRVSAVVAIAGICDRRRDIGLPLGLLGKGYEEKFDLRVASSPVIYVNPKTVPVYILHGDHDSVADVSSARQLAAALQEARVSHELRIVDADHYPINVDELALIADWLAKVI